MKGMGSIIGIFTLLFILSYPVNFLVRFFGLEPGGVGQMGFYAFFIILLMAMYGKATQKQKKEK
jgi:hypothetical protein